MGVGIIIEAFVLLQTPERIRRPESPTSEGGPVEAKTNAHVLCVLSAEANLNPLSLEAQDEQGQGGAIAGSRIDGGPEFFFGQDLAGAGFASMLPGGEVVSLGGWPTGGGPQAKLGLKVAFDVLESAFREAIADPVPGRGQG